MNRNNKNSRKRRFQKIALLTISLLLIPPIFGDVVITDDTAKAQGIDDGGVKVRVLEGRIGNEAFFRSDGPLAVIFGKNEIPIVNEPLSISISKAGGLTLLAGKRRYTTKLDIKIRAAEGDLISVGTDIRRTKSYRGEFNIYNDDDTIAVINTVPLKYFLYSVVASEMYTREPEATKAQAILARTFAEVNRQRHTDYDFCDKTHCQHYGGAGIETPISIRAVDETAGMVILFEGKPAQVFYHACCGGITTTPANVWGGKDLPYLKPVKCESPAVGYLCGGSDHFRWEAKIERNKMRALLFDAFGVTAESLTILLRDPSGRVSRIKIAGPDGRVISGEEFRIAVGRALGWSTIKSALFEMDIVGDNYLFKGRGLGHGTGMCQEGAIRLSRMGWSCEEILQFYFPGTAVGGM